MFMKKYINMKTRISIIFCSILATIVLTGCDNNTTTVKDNQSNLEKSELALMHKDLFVRDIKINHLKNFDISVEHYNEGKLIKKQPLILDEKDSKDYLDINVLLAMSFGLDERTIQSHFYDNGAVGDHDFVFKHKFNLSKNDLLAFYPELKDDNKIILGGLYLKDKDNENDKKFETVCSKECLLFSLYKEGE